MAAGAGAVAAGGPGAVSIEMVHVWLVDLELPPAHLTALKALLDPGERRRLAGLSDATGRRRFTAAHGAFRTIVGDWLGIPPRRLRWRRGPAGKPELAGAQANLSHSGEVAAVAVTDRRAVGVDIQRMSYRLDAARFAVRFFTDAESRFVTSAGGAMQRADRLFQLWVRKEACVKAAGGRLAKGMRLPVAAVEPACQVPAHPAVLVRDPAGALPGDYLVRDLAAPPGFRAAVALAGSDPYRVLLHRWPDERR